MEDTNGEPLHFFGEMTFKITIEGRTTTIGAWVTNEIQTGQLILASGVPQSREHQNSKFHPVTYPIRKANLLVPFRSRFNMASTGRS